MIQYKNLCKAHQVIGLYNGSFYVTKKEEKEKEEKGEGEGGKEREEKEEEKEKERCVWGKRFFFQE